MKILYCAQYTLNVSIPTTFPKNSFLSVPNFYPFPFCLITMGSGPDLPGMCFLLWNRP